MVAHRTVKEGEELAYDKQAQQIIGIIAGNYAGDAADYEEILLRTGSEPSHAIIGVPITPGVTDEVAGTVLAGFANQIKHGDRGSVSIVANSHVSSVFLCGSVVDIYRDLGLGSVVIRMLDDRRLMRNVHIRGCFVWNHTTETIDYINSMPALFNPGGRPNCIYGSDGKPYFSPWPEFGLDEGELPPPPADGHTSKACYWVLSSIFEYLRNKYGPEAEPAEKYEYFPRCPDTVIWPETVAAGIDKDAVSNYDQGVEQNPGFQDTGRKGREFYAEGMDLNSVITLLLDTAGGWTWWLAPQESEDDEGNTTYEQILEIVPKRFTGQGATFVFQHRIDGNAEDAAVINGGGWGENSEELATCAMVAGDPIVCENRVDSREVSDGGTYTLIPAWTTARYDEYRARVLADLSFDDANRLFPEVLTMWQISSDFEFHSVGSLAEFPRAALPRQLLSRLVSFMGGDSGSVDFATMRFPISYEYLNAGGNWVPADEHNGTRVLDDGRIWIPGLRLNGKSWRWTSTLFADDGSGKAAITLQPIRFTCAIPTDHRLMAVADTAGFSSGSVTEESGPLLHDFGDNLPESDRVNSNLRLVHYVDAEGLYKCWLRSTGSDIENDSWPRPESLNSDQGKPEAKTTFENALRSDHEMLLAHARKALYDRSRLVGRGELIWNGWFVGSVRPGMLVEDLVSSDGETTIKVQKAIREVRFKGRYEHASTSAKLG